MSLTRREFIKLCSGTVAGLGISQILHPAILQALNKAVEGKPPVIWLQGQGCTGCSVSLLNTVHPNIADLLLKIISLEYHPTIMAWEGEGVTEHMYEIARKYKGQFFLIVEGAIPVKERGRYCVIGELGHREITMLDATGDLGKAAAVCIAVGTCATFGGIPAAKGNLTGAAPVTKVFKNKRIKTPVVNIPGCPPHPDWMVGSLSLALEKGLGEVVKILDEHGRPKLFFGDNIHDNCPYLKYFEEDKYSQTFTQKDACRYELGCKGCDTSADCFKRRWNNGINWCLQNAVCIGCVEPGFPDDMSPFYEAG